MTMTNESGPAFGIIHRPDMTPAELGCCCAANAQAMHEGNLRDLLFDVARVLSTNESGLREKIVRAIGSLEREPLAAITSLDGTVKEPLICLTVSERDAILALISPAGEVVVPVVSPLERERFLSILGERLEAAFNAGAEWAQGFDSRREAHGVLDLLSAAPGGMEG